MALPKIDVPRYPVKLPSTRESYTMRPYFVKEEKVLLLAISYKQFLLCADSAHLSYT